MARIGGRLSPRTSVLSKASLPWYAQNPLHGCRRFAGSQRPGMLVKTELTKGSEEPPPTQSPISPIDVFLLELPYNQFGPLKQGDTLQRRGRAVSGESQKRNEKS